MKTYITFGQVHTHSVNGKTFDKDCVAVIESLSAEAGRAKAFEIFGREFCMEYPEEHFNHDSLKSFFPRGLINVEPAA